MRLLGGRVTIPSFDSFTIREMGIHLDFTVFFLTLLTSALAPKVMRVPGREVIGFLAAMAPPKVARPVMRGLPMARMFSFRISGM